MGILLKNENKASDMIGIVNHIHHYVPAVPDIQEQVLSTGETVDVDQTSLHTILFGGDQLTCARARSAIDNKLNSQTPHKRFMGIEPVIEDWHTKVNFLRVSLNIYKQRFRVKLLLFVQVIWKYYYNPKSSAEHGTLFQLRNVIHRTNVVKDPMKNYNACDDFFVLVIESHIVALAMNILGMTNADQAPDSSILPDAHLLWMQPDDFRTNVLKMLTLRIVDELSLNFNNFVYKDTDDKVRQYSIQLSSLGCLYLEYSDAIREGDGNRVLRCWRYMLPIFASSGCKNYAIEAFNLLLQHDYILPPQEAGQLIWGRFINVKGQPGHNIPNDLHMEHLNRILKQSISGLGANKSASAMQRVAQALGAISPFLRNFDEECKISQLKGVHNRQKAEQDMKILLTELAPIVSLGHSRRHKTFTNPCDPLHMLSYSELNAWIEKHIT